jgi:hypothetical protein
VLNGLYHLLAGCLLWLFLRRIGAGAGLAACVALVWTGHPLACESVCWVSERKNVLCALFGFGALLAWTAQRRCAWRLPLASLLYALAGLSKPTALGLLPVFVALEVLDPPRREFSWREPRQWVGLVERLGPLAAISAGLLAGGLYTVRTDIVEPPGGTAFTALLTDAGIFARYAAHILCPVSLSFFYAVEPIVSLGDWRLWLYGLGLLAFCGGLICAAGRERRALAWLGVLWFFGALGPHSNLVASPFWMQDRYVYLSSAGLLLAVGAAAIGLLHRTRQQSLLPALGAVAIAATLGLGAWRAKSFASYASLSLQAAERQPASAMAQLCAANVLRDRYCELARQCEQLPRGSPHWQQELEGAQHCAAEALKHFETAQRCAGIRMFVDDFTLRLWAAEVLVALGRYEEACARLGPLPPPDLPMLQDAQDAVQPAFLNRQASFAGYPPRTLAGAWLIRGESSLRQCGVPGITAAQKLALAERARQEAEESLKVHKMDHEACVLWARAQIVISDLYAARMDMATALKLYNEAVAKLKEVPPGSLSAFGAQRILENVPPPKESGK